METITKTAFTNDTTQIKKRENSTGFWEMAEFNRFGIITFVFGLIGCLGGTAVGFGADNPTQLAIVILPTILTLAITLAVAPMRVILTAATIAILADIAVFIF